MLGDQGSVITCDMESAGKGHVQLCCRLKEHSAVRGKEFLSRDVDAGLDKKGGMAATN